MILIRKTLEFFLLSGFGQSGFAHDSVTLIRPLGRVTRDGSTSRLFSDGTPLPSGVCAPVVIGLSLSTFFQWALVSSLPDRSRTVLLREK